MIENLELLEKVRKYKEWKKGRKFIANQLDIKLEEVDRLIEELNNPKIEEEDSQTWEYTGTQEYNLDEGTFKSSVIADFEPKDHKELAELHKIDTNKYKISSYWTKQKGEKFTSSVFCTLIKPSDFDPEKFSEFLKDYKPPKVSVELKKSKEAASSKVDVEISIADFHLDRQTLKNDTLVGRKEEYLRVLKALINVVYSSYSIDRVVFVIGNDFFNNDNYQGTTTNGTPQDNAVRFNEAFEEGFDLLVQAISLIKAISDCVLIKLVQGNHDRTKSYYLAHSLEMFFKNEPDIIFDRTHSTTKYVVLGDTFIGYHHGNTKIDELPLLFATSEDTARHFGNAKYREVKTADKHFYMAKEIKGVRIQQLPSMVNPDRWSTDNNYLNNIRAAIATVYHPTKGRIMEIEERI